MYTTSRPVTVTQAMTIQCSYILRKFQIFDGFRCLQTLFIPHSNSNIFEKRDFLKVRIRVVYKSPVEYLPTYSRRSFEHNHAF